MIDDGQARPDFIFFTDETWLLVFPGSRKNPQNRRLLFPASMKRAELAELLIKEKKQRAPGVMLRLTVAALDGGVYVAPYFSPGNQTVAAATYQGALEGVTPPEIRQVMAARPGQKWHFQQDGAPPHTAVSAESF